MGLLIDSKKDLHPFFVYIEKEHEGLFWGKLEDLIGISGIRGGFLDNGVEFYMKYERIFEKDNAMLLIASGVFRGRKTLPLKGGFSGVYEGPRDIGRFIMEPYVPLRNSDAHLEQIELLKKIY